MPANLQQLTRSDEVVLLRDIWGLAKCFPPFAGFKIRGTYFVKQNNILLLENSVINLCLLFLGFKGRF